MFYNDAKDMCKQNSPLSTAIKNERYKYIFPVPRGGYALGSYISANYKIKIINNLPRNSLVEPSKVLVVDDVIDSGATRQKYKKYDFAAIHRKSHAVHTTLMKTIPWVDVDGGTWIDYPWEKNESSVQESVVRLLEVIGEDPNREGLRDTPKRIENMYKQVFHGYDPDQMPQLTTFANEKDSCDFVHSLIIDKGYYFSHCEHHMVPFFGQYYFGYIPNCAIIGCSKIARLIDYYAAKLQIQERLAIEVVNKMEEVLQPHGIILMLRGRHLCKEMRGVRKYHSPFENIEARGWLLENRNGSKDEFIARCSVPDII